MTLVCREELVLDLFLIKFSNFATLQVLGKLTNLLKNLFRLLTGVDET